MLVQACIFVRSRNAARHSAPNNSSDTIYICNPLHVVGSLSSCGPPESSRPPCSPLRAPLAVSICPQTSSLCAQQAKTIHWECLSLLLAVVIQSELETAGNQYSKSFILQVVETCSCKSADSRAGVRLRVWFSGSRASMFNAKGASMLTTLLLYSYTSYLASAVHRQRAIRNPSGMPEPAVLPLHRATPLAAIADSVAHPM